MMKNRLKIIKKEQGEYNHIPIIRHVTDKILKTENDDYFFTIKLNGITHETIDDIDLDIQADIRNTLLKSFDGKPLIFYAQTIRKKQKIKYKPIKSSSSFIKKLDKSYNKKFKDGIFFINELYLTVLRKGKKYKSKFFKESENHEQQIIREVKDYMTNIDATLSNYIPNVLTIKNGISEPLKYLSNLINMEEIDFKVPNGPIKYFLPRNRKIFGPRSVEIQKSTGSIYGALISIKEYCSDTYAGMLDQLNSLPFEFITTITWQIAQRQKAIEKVDKTRRQMEQGDKAITLASDLELATDQIASNDISMGENNISLFVYSDTIKGLNDAIGLFQAEFGSMSIVSVLDNINLEPAFWAQIPGNIEYVARSGMISSFNYAHFASFHNLPLGSKMNIWGDYITVLSTTAETPYYFNWHYGQLGLVTIVGPSDSGKTVVLLHLIAQSYKHNPTVFIFDKDRGCEIFIRACNGKYSLIENGKNTGWNPLSLDFSKGENVQFLSSFLKLILQGNNEAKLDDEESVAINDLVLLIVKQQKEAKKNNQSCHRLQDFTSSVSGILPHRELAFQRWIEGGEYGWVFDNDNDELEISDYGVMYGFDMTNFLDNKDLRTPILHYLFHKINIALTGKPAILVVDECQKASEDELFHKTFEDHANTIRKKNAIVVMATQRAKAMKINESLVEQAPTQIFFANPKAKKEDYEVFGLSDREIEQIQNIPMKRGFFLLKKPDGAVVVRADLSGLDDELAVLSGNRKTIALMEKLIEQHSQDPEIWLPYFYDERRYL